MDSQTTLFAHMATSFTVRAQKRNRPTRALRRPYSVVVMTFALYDFDYFVCDSVDCSVFIVYSPAPIPGKISFQRLGFSDTAVSVSDDIREQGINLS